MLKQQICRAGRLGAILSLLGVSLFAAPSADAQRHVVVKHYPHGRVVRTVRTTHHRRWHMTRVRRNGHWVVVKRYY